MISNLTGLLEVLDELIPEEHKVLRVHPRSDRGWVLIVGAECVELVAGGQIRRGERRISLSPTHLRRKDKPGCINKISV